ncbi:peptide chain release factor N(5)-glutamine methyltransferase [Gordonia neofelifaecis]|uniref:peptide chain release factor N(5)-glutamine methyltransferase n=1 Tax=Gordonia neofelifaecis NRRL B-59395 TaxID=644548 RepID=F1YFB8_9ACTN|nr:peptide chain release factor N(5)-glutamine methyltransferase [Gordonia neofelifaecis]EGD56690.1 N5-glutamine S-adenosyl-L-methionine-dependent methyltransferase [Gordonia neofelifaecis NRRL B-59395]
MSGLLRRSADAVRRAAAQRLTEAGIDSAAAEAGELVAQVLGVEPGRLLLIDDVSDADRSRIDDAVSRRVQRVPLQHITSRAHFAGVELTVGPGVFVPRPETELIVEWAVAEIAELRRTGIAPIRVVDLCSGSGALAVAIAAHAPDVQVTAVELAETASEYLRRNVHDLGLAGRVSVVRADVTDATAMSPILTGAHVVVSNPPYVPAQAAVSPEVAHDPPEAVFSGDSGMELIDALVPILAAALSPAAVVAIEHDDTTSEAVCDALARAGGFADVRPRRDLAGRPRFVTAVHRAVDDPARSAGDGVEGWNA